LVAFSILMGKTTICAAAVIADHDWLARPGSDGMERFGLGRVVNSEAGLLVVPAIA